MLEAVWKKNDAKARNLIIIFSIIVFAAVSVLGRYNLSGKVELPFDVHLFALANAIINGTVAVLLLIGLAYLAIPAISIAMGFLLKGKMK